MKLQFSIIIPVYNIPQEIDELLNSLTKQAYSKSFEVVVVEDGSENISKENKIRKGLNIGLNIDAHLSENHSLNLRPLQQE